MKNTRSIGTCSTMTIIILSTLCGCLKKVPCSDSFITLAFVNFTSAELDTIVVRKFQRDDNYQHLVDTANVYNDSASLYWRSHDTAFVTELSQRLQGIQAYNDWQIFLPAMNRTVSISTIATEQKADKCSTLADPANCACINKIYSLKKDNIQVDLSNVNQYMSGYNVYIYK